jgi:outer membrane usher protein
MRIASELYRIAMLLAVAVLLLARSARADEADQPAVLTLILNEVKHGEVIVVLRGSDVWTTEADLKDAGLHDLHGRSETILGKRYVSLASLTPPLRFAFDEAALTLRVTAPAELLPTTVIDMRPGAPAGIAQRTDTSAFLNYTATLSDFTHPSGFVEAGLSMGGAFLLTSSVAASLETGVTRNLTSLVIDDRKTLARWTLGDSFVTSGELGSGLFVGGLSVSRSFEIDPYLIRQPSLGYAGSALTPSKLDIYVNGTLLRSEDVAPGSFQVKNLPIATGTGDVRYLLRDAFGREHAVASPYSMVSTQLAKGQSDYTYALGSRRQKVGQASFDYGEPAMLAHHRLGLTDTLTLGARVEASGDLLSGGSTLDVLLPYGNARFSIAASVSPGASGFAGAARYGFASRKFSAAAMVQAMSHRYATLSLDPAVDRSTLEANLMTSVAAGPRLNLASSYSLAVPRDAPARFGVALSVHVALTKDLQLVCGASRTMMSDLRSSGEVSAVLTWSFGRGIMASAGARLDGAGPQAFAEVNRPIREATGMGLRASGTIGAHPRGDAIAEYQGSYGRYRAAFSMTEGGPHLALEASGAIVALEGAGVFPTVPIQNGFAVIRVPKIKGVHGYLDNREIGTTSSGGSLVIPNLLPYYGNRLRISDQDLPLDYSIEKTEQLVAPPLRGGALALFAAQRVKFYRGRALLQMGDEKKIPVYGEIAFDAGNETVTSPLGKAGEFEVSDIAPGRHQARISHEGRACVLPVDAPDGEGPVIDLGLLVCKQ